MSRGSVNCRSWYDSKRHLLDSLLPGRTPAVPAESTGRDWRRPEGQGLWGNWMVKSLVCMVMIYGWCRIDPFNQWSKYRTIFPLLIFSLWDKGRLLNRRLCPNLYSFIAKFSQFATHPWPPPFSIHSVIDHMFSTNRGDLSKLEYLTQVIKEGMRLHCPVPFIQRQLTQPATIEGLFDLRRFLFVIFYLMTTWFSALFTRSHQWYEMSWFHLITSWYR